MTKANSPVLTLISVLLAGLIAGCTSEQAQPTEALPSDPWGVVKVQPNDPIRVGLSLSEGDLSLGAESVEIERGAQLAIENFGPISDKKVEMVTVDTPCSLEGGATAAQKLSTDRSLLGAVGPACQNACLGAANGLETAHLTTITGTCGPDSLFQSSSQEGILFRTIYSDSVEGELAAQFAFSELGSRRAVIIQYDTNESATFAGGFQTRFDALGGKVVDSIDVHPGTREFRIILATLSGLRPDVIYLPLLPADSASFVEGKADSIVAKIPLVGTRYTWSSWFASQVGDKGAGTYATGPKLDKTKFEQVASLYRQKYSSEPSSGLFAYTYDAMHLLLVGLREAGVSTASGDFYVGRKALSEAVRNTAAYDGITGELTCTPWGDCGVASLAVGRLDKTGWTTIFVP